MFPNAQCGKYDSYYYDSPKFKLKLLLEFQLLGYLCFRYKTFMTMDKVHIYWTADVWLAVSTNVLKTQYVRWEVNSDRIRMFWHLFQEQAVVYGVSFCKC